MEENSKDDALAWGIRDALARLADERGYDQRAVARQLDVPYRTVNRYLTVDGKDQKLPPLPFVINLLGLMADDAHVIEVESPGQWLDKTITDLSSDTSQ